MKAYLNRFSVQLLTILVSAPVNVTTNGKALRILPDQSDNQTDASQDYRFVSTLNFVGGSGSPTAQLVIQGSVDGVTWIDVAPGASRVGAGTFFEIIDVPAAPLLPWIRARLIIGGTTAPNIDTTVEVVSTGPFQLSPS